MLEGPHEQEPNQQKCPTADGYCDDGLADLIINQLAVEQQNIVTDPLLHSWQDSAGNEVTDECRNFFAPTLGGSVGANEETGAGTLYNQEIAGGKYYLERRPSTSRPSALHFPGVFCHARHQPGTRIQRHQPRRGRRDGGLRQRRVDHHAQRRRALRPDRRTEQNFAKMKWNFGDGSPEVAGYAPGSPPCNEPWLSECAESVFHTYTAGGTYTVTLTVTDVGGNTASVSHEVTVVGPPPEKSTPPPPGACRAAAEARRTSVSGGATRHHQRRHDRHGRLRARSGGHGRGRLPLAEDGARARAWPSTTRSTSRWRALRGAARPEDGQAPEDPRQPRHGPARPALNPRW